MDGVRKHCPPFLKINLIITSFINKVNIQNFTKLLQREQVE